jgi:tetratricopeptide (TPR) repeat protein
MRRLLLSLAVIVSIGAGGIAVTAQTPETKEPKLFEKSPDKSVPGRPPGPEKAPTGDGKGADGTAPTDADKTAARSPLSRIPETQEEKDRLLQDLYAHLATADDETEAEPVANAIERIWGISGSDTVNLLLDRATNAHTAKNDNLAYKLFDHLIELAPDYTEIWTRRAFVHYQNNEFSRAVADLRRVLAIDPNHFKALDGLVTIWRDVGFKKGALAVVRHLLDVYPLSSGAKQAAEELEREVEGQSL